MVKCKFKWQYDVFFVNVNIVLIKFVMKLRGKLIVIKMFNCVKFE